MTRLFVERNRSQRLGDIVRILSVYADRGEIDISDPQTLVEHFFMPVVGIPQRLALLDIRETPD